MRKPEVETVRRMIADREAEEPEMESPVVRVSLIDLIFWAAEIFMIGACASLLVVVALR